MKFEGAVGARLDEFRDIVAVAGLVADEGEDEELGAAFFPLAIVGVGSHILTSNIWHIHNDAVKTGLEGGGSSGEDRPQTMMACPTRTKRGLLSQTSWRRTLIYVRACAWIAVFALASAAEAAPRVIAGGRYCHAVASGSAQAPSDAIRTLTTALSEAPVRVPGENKIVRFRGFDFTAEGRLQPPFFGASPGGEWIAIMGSMGVAIYDVASGDKVVDIQTSERLTRPGWISDRHFIVLIGQSMMVCDLRAPESAASTIWNLPSKEAEILGFREEASIGDVAGRAGRIALYVGVRVPVPGQYRVALTVENERGNSITSSQQAELSNVVSQVEIDVDPPRGADGLLTIRDVTLERNVGSNWAPIAQRAMLGAIGPYRLSKTASKVSTAAKTPLIATTPLKTATL